MQRKLTLGYGYMWQGLPEVESNVYHIGLTNANLSTDEVIVQLSPIGQDLISIHMNKFNEAISTGPDISAVPTADHAKILQTLY